MVISLKGDKIHEMRDRNAYSWIGPYNKTINHLFAAKYFPHDKQTILLVVLVDWCSPSSDDVYGVALKLRWAVQTPCTSRGEAARLQFLYSKQ